MESNEDNITYTFDISPQPAVRSQGARSMKSPTKKAAVKRYINYKKDLKALFLQQGLKVIPPEIEAITFLLPIPDPTVGSKKVKAEKLSRIGNPHQQKPDIDNLVKPIFDAGKVDDSHIWRMGEVKKVWTNFGFGQIIITIKRKYVLSL